MGENEYGRMRETEEFESGTKSSSENHEVGSGDDQLNQRPKKKRYHRHTQHQIQQMEAYVTPQFPLISFFLFY